MKKFNPNEYSDFQMGAKKNGSTINNFFVPVLIVACSCLAMLGITFSAKLVGDDTNIYNVRIDIINGNEEFYEQKVIEGAFRTEIKSNNSFGSISCTKGELKYDPLTSTISSVYINQDTACILVFKEDGFNQIDTNNLNAIYDINGTGYYFKANADNNYIKIDNKIFRIIRINGDGTLRVMLNEVVLSSDYGSEYYSDSNLKKTLKKWYETNMSGFNYIVEREFDDNNYEDNYDSSTLFHFDRYIIDYVGTLSVTEVELMMDGVEDKYLDTIGGIWLLNPSGFEFAHYFHNGQIQLGNINEQHYIRPVINIKVDSLKGDGTEHNPYTFE